MENTPTEKNGQSRTRKRPKKPKAQRRPERWDPYTLLVRVSQAGSGLLAVEASFDSAAAGKSTFHQTLAPAFRGGLGRLLTQLEPVLRGGLGRKVLDMAHQALHDASATEYVVHENDLHTAARIVCGWQREREPEFLHESLVRLCGLPFELATATASRWDDHHALVAELWFGSWLHDPERAPERPDWIPPVLSPPIAQAERARRATCQGPS